MTRQKAIKALMALPTLRTIRVATLKPSDVIVVECTRLPDTHDAAFIKASIEAIWPDHRVLLLGPQMRLKVLRRA